MKQIQVNGVSLEYAEKGAGVPVVFSHGGASDLRYWKPQREIFAKHYRYVSYSHRFHGRGKWPAEGDYSAEAHVADLLAIIQSLGSGPVHLVGFSAAIALRATLSEPRLVRSLTIIEPNISWLLEGDAEGEKALTWWREENLRVDAEAAGDGERAAKLWFELVNNRGPGAFDAQPEGLRRMWLDNFGTTRPTAPPPEPLTCEKLSEIATPTLVLGAEHGMLYSRRIVELLVRCIPHCHLVVVPAVTHFMSYQEPVVFNEVVLDFLANH